ncbi:hypothetical protein M378DRAFT_159723 [Amanita muscaria Koide BX008]|uniref:Uncharacterized protein n=1 Tax=Amanita muscaria (strain Koide BX008) TaxID=946122 RepID=A0A0C2XEP7_AMAMK|nr:hypothetical protein M378DRAFT_159723 [Amanita muscaria Koide BX008]
MLYQSHSAVPGKESATPRSSGCMLSNMQFDLSVWESSSASVPPLLQVACAKELRISRLQLEGRISLGGLA